MPVNITLPVSSEMHHGLDIYPRDPDLVEDSYDESLEPSGLRSRHIIGSISRKNEEILLENIEWGYSKLFMFLSCYHCHNIPG